MNAIIGTFSKPWIVWRFRFLSVRFLSLLTLVMALMTVASAFAIIYFKDFHRRLFIDYQQQMVLAQNEQVRWGKLLLEESAWSTQARIQRIAQNRLGMTIPAYHRVVMVALNNNNPVSHFLEHGLTKKPTLAENDVKVMSQSDAEGT